MRRVSSAQRSDAFLGSDLTFEGIQRLRALLVNPAFPETYWSLSHALPLLGKRRLSVPLPLITVAALLPRHWDCRLADLAAETVSDDELRWADLVLLTGMLIQRRSLHEVLERCRRLGVRTVVGGPYATSMPELLEAADHLVLGEGEEIVPRFATDFEAGVADRIYREATKPDMSLSPVPRYDLLKIHFYLYLSVQFSRGCPFQCEFCDIITFYGRVPRTKAPSQVIAELEAILATGFRGRVLFVDDNFIGSKKDVRRLLREIAAWRSRTRAPLDFFTETSIDLADRPELVRAMTDAGFAVVFVGIETPSVESLRETRKLQNVNRDLVKQVRSLRAAGLDVWAGFILGFDSDGPDIFDRMIDFVQRAGIAYAMVGTLIALPGTPLYDRLRREGRLRPDLEHGDMFDFSNVETTIPTRQLVDGYIRVLETLYHPKFYFERCREHLDYWEEAPGLARNAAWNMLPAVFRSLWHQGVRSGYRRAYWSFLAWVLRNWPRKLPLAMAQAIGGHHFIRYTQDTVVPRLWHESRSWQDNTVRSSAQPAASTIQR